MTEKQIKNIKKKLIGKRFTFEDEELIVKRVKHTRYVDIERVEVEPFRTKNMSEDDLMFKFYSKDGVIEDGVRSERIDCEIVFGEELMKLLLNYREHQSERCEKLGDYHLKYKSTLTKSPKAVPQIAPNPSLFQDTSEKI